MTNLGLSAKILWREWRGGELRILLFAFIIAVACISALTLLGKQIEQSIQQQASSLLGGDLAIISSEPIPDKWLAEAGKLSLKTAQSVQLLTMAQANSKFQLASIKGVSNNYPLVGQLSVKQRANQQPVNTTSLPPPGTIWASSRLFNLLGIQAGDSIKIGNQQFMINRILINEPDRGFSFYNLSPKIIMRLSDLKRTQLIQRGSRLRYKVMFVGSANAINKFQAYLKTNASPTYRIVLPKQSSQTLARAFAQTQSIINIFALFSIFLACVAIFLASQRFISRQQIYVALMNCFGASKQRVIGIYIGIIFLISILGIIIGTGIGLIFQSLLVTYFASWLPVTAMAISLQPIILTVALGWLLLFCFTGPAIYQLKNISPALVLNNIQTQSTSNRLIVFGLVMAFITLCLYWYGKSIMLTIAILLLLLISIGIIGLILFVLAKIINQQKHRFNIHLRFGMLALVRNRYISLLQVGAYCSIITFILVVLILRTNVLTQWYQDLPKSLPNVFAINILPNQTKPLTQLLKQQGLKIQGFYPLVRGRLSKINNQAAIDFVPSNAKNNYALQRPLNLTWTTQLPDDNKILQGKWLTSHKTDAQAQVSVEARLAERLGITLGDRITFTIADQQVTARVSSLRSVNWSTFRPNFYFIFQPGVLNQYPFNYMTSFYISNTNRSVLNSIVQRFPNISLIDVTEIMQRAQSIVQKLSKAISYLVLTTLLAGIAVLIASIISTTDARRYEQHMLRTLGANNRMLLSNTLTEFALLGFVAGAIAAITVVGILWTLTRDFLHIPLHLPGVVIGLTPILSAICIALLGWLFSRSSHPA